MTVKAALVMTVASWMAFFSVQATAAGSLSIIHLTFAGLFCMLLFSFRNSGRILCSLYHVIMAAIIFADAFSNNQAVLMMSACAPMFSVSALLLLMPKTAGYFKNASQPPQSNLQ